MDEISHRFEIRLALFGLRTLEEAPVQYVILSRRAPHDQNRHGQNGEGNCEDF
jgi:hypothetical protein